jgi:hypothetical protein
LFYYFLEVLQFLTHTEGHNCALGIRDEEICNTYTNL